MAPTVFRDESRIHIHVSHTDGEAKYWIEPKIELAMNQGLSQKQLNEALLLVERHLKEILNAWRTHFEN
ncbi:MAG: DUF4160 domain-containing protein [Betaproteobacteria bacterium]